MRTKRSIKDSLKEYLNWCVGRLLLGGSRDDTVRDMVDAISDEIASGGGGVSQDQLDQTVKDITKSYGIADQTVLTSAEQYTDQKIADVVDGSPEALDTLYELAKALGDDPNFATTVMGLIGQKLPTTTFENFIDNKAWTKDNLTKLSQLINNINSIKAGTRVESMDVNLASISSYLEYDLFDNNTTGTKPPGLTTGFLLTFSWDNGGWGAQIATSDGNVDGAIFLRTIKASESDKIWGPWVSLYNTANFNPDSKLNYNGFNGDLNTISTSGLYRLVSGCTNTPNSGSSQGCHIIHTNWDTNAAHQLYFEYYGSMFYRYKHGGEWSDWKRVWTEFEFNPNNYLPLSGNKMITGDFQLKDGVAVRDAAGRSVVGLLDVAGDGVCVAVGNGVKKTRIITPDDTPVYRNDSKGAYRIYDSSNFNPDNYLNAKKGLISDLNTATGSGVYYFSTPGSVNTPENYGSLLVVATVDNGSPWINQFAFGTSNKIWHRQNINNAGWNSWTYLYDSSNFNPDNYLLLSGGTMTGDITFGSNGRSLRGSDGGNIAGVLYDTPNARYVTAIGTGSRRLILVSPDSIYRGAGGVAENYMIYDSSNLGNATTSKAGLMSAADKTKLDGLSGGGLNIPAYIFPGDPSKLNSSASPTHITSILGTAIDLLDAFNNGRVFISKTVTFNEVQVPSDITYSLLKSIDPDNPTIFQIIMSTVVWGHYIEITIDFENNEYQAISNTINGIIGVNNTGTTN